MLYLQPGRGLKPRGHAAVGFVGQDVTVRLSPVYRRDPIGGKRPCLDTEASRFRSSVLRENAASVMSGIGYSGTLSMLDR